MSEEVTKEQKKGLDQEKDTELKDEQLAAVQGGAEEAHNVGEITGVTVNLASGCRQRRWSTDESDDQRGIAVDAETSTEVGY